MVISYSWEGGREGEVEEKVLLSTVANVAVSYSLVAFSGRMGRKGRGGK